MSTAAIIQWGLGAIVLIVMSVTAVCVSYQIHQYHLLTTQWQHLQLLEDKLNAEWSRLLLEQGIYSRHSRVEFQATQQLKMRLPNVEETIVVMQP